MSARFPPFFILHGTLIALLCGSAPAQTAEEQGRRAAQAMNNKDYAAAEQAYRRIVRLAPEMAEAQSNLGLACYLQQKIPCAEEAFNRSLKLRTDLFLPNFLLGQIRFQQGRYQDAVPLLERAVEQQPRHTEVRQLLGATLVGVKEYDRAAAQYQALLQADPKDVEGYYGLGRIYMELSQTVIQRLEAHKDAGYDRLLLAEHNAPYEQWRPLALDSYKDAISRGIPVPGVRIAYASLLISNKDWAGAQNTLQDELRLDPYSYEAKFHLARTAIAQDDVTRAAQYLDEAAAIRPEFFDPAPQFKLDAEVAQKLARHEQELRNKAAAGSFGASFLITEICQADGRFIDAKDWRQKSETARRNLLAGLSRPIARPSSSAAAIELGSSLLKRKRYESGLELLLPLAQKHVLSGAVEVEVARSLYGQRRFEELASIFRGTVPSDPQINYLLGLSYKELALATLRRMVELDPESVRAHQVLGDTYFAQESYVDAAKEYEFALKIEPKNPELYFLLGNSYYKQMQFALAVDQFDRAIGLDPLNAEAHLMRGDALVRLGDSTGAIPSLEKSLELNPGLSQAHVLLGKSMAEAGKFELALAHLEKGLDSDKDGSVHYQLFLIYRKLKRPAEAEAALRKSQNLRQAASAASMLAPK
jgi:tetratricopeptide (TPR) repeat protein